MSSYFTNIRSLKKRPLGGLTVGGGRHVGSGLTDQFIDDWIYDYSYWDMMGTEDSDYDILKITSMISGTQIDRYFYINNLGKALFLCRRVICPDEPSTNQSYVIGTDRLLCRNYKSRVYPLVTRNGKHDYVKHSNDIFTPILFTPDSVHALIPYIAWIPERSNLQSPIMEWIDSISIQGWFPISVLLSLHIEEPCHSGWSIEGAFYDEISKYLRESLPISLVEEVRFSDDLANLVGNSSLHDFKICISVDFLEHPECIDLIETFSFYNPELGEIFELNERDDEIGNTIEIERVQNFIIKSKHYLSTEIKSKSADKIIIYRCLNDFVYVILINSYHNCAVSHMVLDFSKHLLVHYGFVDIPTQALMLGRD